MTQGKKGKKQARAIQKATGWPYTRALAWVRKNEALIQDYVAEGGCTKEVAAAAVVAAEVENG